MTTDHQTRADQLLDNGAAKTYMEALLMAEIEELKSRIEWRPIETAPRDKFILGINMSGNPPYMPFIMRSTFIADDNFKSCSAEACWKERLAEWPSYPTHWLPLPAPPKGE